MAKKLYVGNLPYSATEESLKDLFSGYSSDITVSIIMDKQTGRSKGFGFVEFNDDAAADQALEKNGSDFDGRSIVVNEARPKEDRPLVVSSKLYVGNLSADTSEDALRSAFQGFGSLVDVVVIKDQESGMSKGFGFVEFSSTTEAEAALEMNGKMLEGNELTVNMARPKPERRPMMGGSSRRREY